MKCRSLLYVPASEKRFIAKANTRGADAIILDLEDSVAPADKDEARARLPASIAQVRQSGAYVFVRINADLETALKDAEAAVKGGAFGLYISKASVAHLKEINAFLEQLDADNYGKPIALVALIEDAAALLDAREIARQPRVMALTVGAEDLAQSMGAAPDPDVVRQPKLMVHYAAKAQGLLSFGMFRTTADYQDKEAIMESACEAKRFGFDGVSCVHPSAVAIMNKAFTPTRQEISWAERVLAKAAETPKGAFSFEGKMVDAPVLARAQRILDQEVVAGIRTSC